MSEVINLSPKVAVLERDVQEITRLLVKLDEAIDKLTEIAASIKQVQAVQESRITLNENNIVSLGARLDKIDARLGALESWKWYVVGASAIVGTVLYWTFTYWVKHSSST